MDHIKSRINGNRPGKEFHKKPAILGYKNNNIPHTIIFFTNTFINFNLPVFYNIHIVS